MAFLQKLRQANIFRPNPATDRPFGMPDTDSSINLQEIASLSSALDDEALRRQKSLIDYGRGQQQGRLRPQVADNVRNLNLAAPKKNVVYGGTEGFSPMQKQFRQDDLIKQQMENEKAQLSENFMRQQDLMRQKRDDSEYMFGKELGARKEMADLDLTRAVKLREVDKLAQAERDRFLAEQRRGDILARERAQGEETRKNLAARPTTATQEKADFGNKAQELVIQYPQIAPYLTKDETTGQLRIAENATPQQAEWIKNKLGMSEKPIKPMPTHEQGVRTQVNSKGQKRISRDGGKTWEMVK